MKQAEVRIRFVNRWHGSEVHKEIYVAADGLAMFTYSGAEDVSPHDMDALARLPYRIMIRANGAPSDGLTLAITWPQAVLDE
jgi:hypothetical protein